ncbi:MAG: methyltransferase [Sphingomonas sp. 28-63-12]|nr:MAG: methyltransferase [Sphingomonas sp. 28-63-12]
MRSTLWLMAGVTLALAVPAAAKQARPDIAAAIAAPGRAADDIKLDEGRKPVEILTFMGLAKGDQVADIMAGNGYYTEIMARAVGPKGHVTAYDPKQFVEGDEKAAAAWAALLGREGNVTHTTYPFEAFAAPANAYDFVMIHLDYHDLYWESAKFKVPKTDPAAFLATLYAAMKPGGTVAVIDHVALPGDTRATVDKLHRIDPATVKADFLKAGFVLQAESDLLRTASDDHTKLVFDPAVRGKTDRFAFRFRKPKG